MKSHLKCCDSSNKEIIMTSMLSIQQNINGNYGMALYLPRIQPRYVKIDIEKIRRDISYTSNELGFNSYDATYLRHIYDLYKNSNILSTWESADDIIINKPIEFVYLLKSGIDTSDYITAEDNENIYKIKYNGLYDAIIYDLVYREYGETFNSMEKKLEHIGIGGVYPIDMLTKNIADNIYSARELMIEDSPYYNKEYKEMHEYFGKKIFKGKYYREVIEYSIRHAQTIIAANIANDLISKDINARLISMDYNGISFGIENGSKYIDDILDKSVSIRVFGRRFESLGIIEKRG